MSGYLLPENIEPEEDACVLVFYPNAPEYKQALLGSLTGLCVWNVWQRTGDDSGSRAANRWKESILRTLESNISCDVLDVVDEDGNVAINVTVQQQQSCASGCCSPDSWDVTEHLPGAKDYPSADEIPSLPDGTYDDGTIVPDGFADRAEYDDYKCQLAGQMVDDFVKTIGSMQTLGGVLGLLGPILGIGFSTGASATGYVFAGLMAVGMTASSAATLMIGSFFLIAAAGLGLFAYFGHVHSELLPLRADMRCDLYNATTPAAARQVFVAYTNDAVTAAALGSLENGDFFTEILFQIVDILIPNELVAGLFELVDSFVGDREYDCSGCGVEWYDVLAPIAVSQGYTLMNGWYTAGALELLNPDGMGNEGKNYCADHNICQDGVDLPQSTSPFSSHLRHDFTADATTMTLRVTTWTYDTFAPDVHVRVIDGGGGAVHHEAYGTATGEHIEEFEVTGLNVGDNYALALSGDKTVALNVERIG